MTSFVPMYWLFFFFSSYRVSIFLSREVLLECHIAVVSFDIMKCSLRSRLLYLRYRASYLFITSSSCFDMLLLLLLLFFFCFFYFFSFLFFFLDVHGLSHLFSCTHTDCILKLFAGHTDFSCSPSANLSGSSVDFFVIGFQLCLLGVEMAVPCGKQMLLDIY